MPHLPADGTCRRVLNWDGRNEDQDLHIDAITIYIICQLFSLGFIGFTQTVLLLVNTTIPGLAFPGFFTYLIGT